MRSNFQSNHLVLPWSSYTKPRDKRGRLETRPKKGSDKVNMQK